VTGPNRLPGDPAAAEIVARIIRVDHAGEYGAKRIYDGQLAVLGNSPSGPVLRRMAEAEARHLKEFERLVAKHRVRPTALSPLWHAAGYALGAATALMGPRAAMACTVAIEEVIDEHYRGQAETLGEAEPELRTTIETFRRDELDHRDTGLAHEAERTPGYELLTGAIKAGSRIAIWLSSRI
jgi:ubiquinone biosynthesis monooxygenase Coq7